MKALSVCQPWAHLIVAGDKAVENRTWRTNYRGELLIHASKSMSHWSPAMRSILGDPRGSRFSYGAIVGRCRLVDCVRVDEANRRGLAYAEGPWCWVLEDRVRFEVPHEYRGSLGLFEVRTLIATLLSRSSTVPAPEGVAS